MTISGGDRVFRTRIREYRKELGLTLLELGHRSNISPGYLCHLERGTRANPSINAMDAICRALGRDIQEVFFQTTEHNRHPARDLNTGTNTSGCKGSDDNAGRGKKDKKTGTDKTADN